MRTRILPLLGVGAIGTIRLPEDTPGLAEAVRLDGEDKAEARRLALREMARPRPTRLVEVVNVRMIPDPAEVALADGWRNRPNYEGIQMIGRGARGTAVPLGAKRPRNEAGGTFTHEHPNRRARRAEGKKGGDF